MELAELGTASLKVLRWLEYLADKPGADDEGKEEEKKKEEEAKEGICALLNILFTTSNIIFISEKQEPKGKSKGKGAPSQIKKQAPSKGKEANKRKADETDDVSGRCSRYTTSVRVFF